MAACFTAAWFEAFLIWLVVVVAAITIINILVPWILGKIGGPPDGGVILQVLRVVAWAVVIIFIIYLVFDLLTCAFGGLPRLGGVR